MGSHLGCPEAILMYHHLKTCSAGWIEPCLPFHDKCQGTPKKKMEIAATTRRATTHGLVRRVSMCKVVSTRKTR
jgi:hypothetical protein